MPHLSPQNCILRTHEHSAGSGKSIGRCTYKSMEEKKKQTNKNQSLAWMGEVPAGTVTEPSTKAITTEKLPDMNSFPKHVANSLIHRFSQGAQNRNQNIKVSSDNKQDSTTIWISAPGIDDLTLSLHYTTNPEIGGCFTKAIVDLNVINIVQILT